MRDKRGVAAWWVKWLIVVGDDSVREIIISSGSGVCAPQLPFAGLMQKQPRALESVTEKANLLTLA